MVDILYKTQRGQSTRKILHLVYKYSLMVASYSTTNPIPYLYRSAHAIVYIHYTILYKPLSTRGLWVILCIFQFPAPSAREPFSHIPTDTIWVSISVTIASGRKRFSDKIPRVNICQTDPPHSKILRVSHHFDVLGREK